MSAHQASVQEEKPTSSSWMGRYKSMEKVAVLGQQITEGDEVLVNGQLLTITPAFVYLALNKPRGITSTTERHIDGNIIDFINYPQRIFPIGRLDKDSEGLILLTNDGSIVNKILDNQNQHEKRLSGHREQEVNPKLSRRNARWC